MIALFIDPSINNVGWAIWGVNNKFLIKYGLYKTQAKGDDRYQELNNLPGYFLDMNIDIDLVVVEMAAHYDYYRHSRYGHDVLKRATQAIMTAFQISGFNVQELPVFTWKRNMKKSFAIMKAKAVGAKLHEIVLSTGNKVKVFPDHVADAICMGDFFCQYRKIAGHDRRPN